MRKKVSAIILSAVMLASIGGLTASANNHLDKEFTFNFSSAAVTTGIRTKYDNSSVYMKCSSATKPYTAHVYSSQEGGKIIDCSYGHTYQFNTGTTCFMLNNVYERGYRNAGVYATRNYGYEYSASGVWSPDSV